MGALLPIAVLLAAAAGKPALPAKPRAATVTPKAAPAAGPVYVFATPAAISFQANDPDSPLVAGNSAATVYALYTASDQNSWNLGVQASAAKFTNCPTVPVSAVTVTCTSVSSGGAKASCGAAVTLSASSQIVAGGTETSGIAIYSVNLTFTLTDSWKYIAELSPQCSVSLTYNASFN